LPHLAEPADVPALTIAGESLSYAALAGAAARAVPSLEGTRRAAIFAEPRLETVVGVVAALAAGVTVVPLNPDSGPRELEHMLADSAPELLLVPPGATVRSELAGIRRVRVSAEPGSDGLPDRLKPDGTAFVLYTSGTTGPPKGAMIPRRAIESNLDGLAEAWEWTGADRLAHALPLFHVHGLILGILGPLRLGGQVEHVGRFSPGALAEALARGATMVFGVPTMYHRLAQEAATDASIADALRSARLLVSGSAALPRVVHEQIERLTGRQICERYGLTETLINTAVSPARPKVRGSVGLPLAGVELVLRDDDAKEVPHGDLDTIGEVLVRGENLFTGYLNRPDATAEALRDGWFHTGDLATWAEDGSIRIVGRRSTDLIKSGGYKIGAGEIEAVLLEHPGVDEVAVAGRPDPDFGERVVAWVVAAPGASVTADELREHVGRLLVHYKRPREFHFVGALPRTPMGKVQKTALEPGP
jgi:malonyl-CoA/methylmalonyl-CoA synthetase